MINNIQQNNLNHNKPGISGAEAMAPESMELMEDDERDVDLEEGDEVSASEEEDKRKKRKKRNDRSNKSKEKLRQNKAVALMERDHTPKDLLEDMAEKLAKKKVKFSQNLPAGLKKEMESSLEAQFKDEYTDKSKDTVSLSSVLEKNTETIKDQVLQKQTRESQSRHVASDRQQQQSERQVMTQGQAASQNVQEKQSESPIKRNKESLTKYLTLMSEALLKPDAKILQESRYAKEKLLQDGVGPKRITQLEGQVRNYIRQDLKKKVKDSFIQLALKYSPKKMTVDMALENQSLEQLSKLAGLKGVFGQGRDSLRETKNEGREDLKSFVTQELDNSIIEAKLRSDDVSELVKAFDKFNHIAGIAKFNTAAYIKTVQRKIEDWGLTEFSDPNLSGVVDSEHQPNLSDTDSQNDRENPHPFATEAVDEIDEKLRTLFMQKSIKLDLKSQVELGLKIASLKRKLKRQGSFKAETFQKMAEEGQALAKVRLTDLLRESFEEKAGIAEIKSPAFKLANKKFKMALKGLKRLDAAPAKADLKVMRDHVNGAMFSIVKEEYLKVSVHLETVKGDPALTRKRKDLQTLLSRLKKESQIKESIDPQMFKITQNTADNSIIEAA